MELPADEELTGTGLADGTAEEVVELCAGHRHPVVRVDGVDSEVVLTELLEQEVGGGTAELRVAGLVEVDEVVDVVLRGIVRCEAALPEEVEAGNLVEECPFDLGIDIAAHRVGVGRRDVVATFTEVEAGQGGEQHDERVGMLLPNLVEAIVHAAIEGREARGVVAVGRSVVAGRAQSDLLGTVVGRRPEDVDVVGRTRAEADVVGLLLHARLLDEVGESAAADAVVGELQVEGRGPIVLQDSRLVAYGGGGAQKRCRDGVGIACLQPAGGVVGGLATDEEAVVDRSGIVRGGLGAIDDAE